MEHLSARYFPRESAGGLLTSIRCPQTHPEENANAAVCMCRMVNQQQLNFSGANMPQWRVLSEVISYFTHSKVSTTCAKVRGLQSLLKKTTLHLCLFLKTFMLHRVVMSSGCRQRKRARELLSHFSSAAQLLRDCQICLRLLDGRGFFKETVCGG